LSNPTPTLLRAGLNLPFLLPLVAISLTLSADRQTREIFGGGCLVLLVAGLALDITNLLTVRALVRPSAAEGRIRYSTTYAYRNGGAQALGLAAGFTQSRDKRWRRASENMRFKDPDGNVLALASRIAIRAA
jgi:hypothetical protein